MEITFRKQFTETRICRLGRAEIVTLEDPPVNTNSQNHQPILTAPSNHASGTPFLRGLNHCVHRRHNAEYQSCQWISAVASECLQSHLSPESLKPLLLGLRVDPRADDESEDVEERHPCVLGEELLRERQCQW